MKASTNKIFSTSSFMGFMAVLLLLAGCGSGNDSTASSSMEQARPPAPDSRQQLTDSEVENIVRRSWQYVAMYNVNNKGAMLYGGWNLCDVDTKLKDHTLKVIARPNNDSLYISCTLDLRKEPVILDIPAFDSKYVSLMVTGYDHYVNIPLSTRQGDFKQPEILYAA